MSDILIDGKHVYLPDIHTTEVCALTTRASDFGYLVCIHIGGGVMSDYKTPIYASQPHLHCVMDDFGDLRPVRGWR